jgi:hypothetical protein
MCGCPNIRFDLIGAKMWLDDYKILEKLIQIVGLKAAGLRLKLRHRCHLECAGFDELLDIKRSFCYYNPLQCEDHLGR